MTIPAQIETPNPASTEGAQPNEGERTYGGFKTVEELEAAYAASQKPADDKPGTNADRVIPEGGDEGNEGDEGGDDGVSDVLKAAGLNQEDFSKEFADTGKLSDESFTKLEKAGFSRDMVRVYLAGLTAEQTTYEAALYAPAGGKDKYVEATKWAAKNFNATEIKAFNDAVTSGDSARASLAVSGLMARARGGKPSLINGRANGEPAAQAFRSEAEVTKAMADPRYRTDPAYRADIAARLRVSDVFNR